MGLTLLLGCLTLFTLLLLLGFGFRPSTLPIITLVILVFFLMNRIYYHLVTIQAVLVLIALLPVTSYVYFSTNIEPLATATVITGVIAASAAFTTFRQALQIVIIACGIAIILAIVEPSYTFIERVHLITAPTFVGIIILTYSYITMHDMQQLHEQSESFNDQQERYRQIFDALPTIVIVYNQDNILYCNKRALKILSLDETTGLKRSIEDFFHNDNSKEMVHDALTSTVRYYDTLHTTQDEAIPVYITATPINFGDSIASLLMIERIDEQKKHDVPNDSQTKDMKKTIPSFSTLLSDYVYIVEFDDAGNAIMERVAGDISTLVGYPSNTEMTIDDWFGRVHPEDQALLQMRFKALKEGETRTIDFRLIAQDGTIRWIRDTTHPILDDAGKLRRVEGILQDITDRIMAEEALRTTVVQQAVVSELGLLANAYDADDDTQMFHQAAQLSHQILDNLYTCIFLHNEQDERLKLVTHISHDETSIAEVNLADSQRFIIDAFKGTEALIIPDFQATTHYILPPEMLDLGIRVFAGIPISGHHHNFGVIVIYRREAQSISDTTLYFLQSVANILGTFIERHRLHKLERAEREFTLALQEMAIIINNQSGLDDVMKTMFNYMKQIVPQMDGSSFMLLDTEADSQQYAYVYDSGFEDSFIDDLREKRFTADDLPILRRMIKTQQPTIVDDVNQESEWVALVNDVKSYLGAPIIVKDECVGFLHLDSYQVAAFSQRDAEHVQAFANKTGNAIINVRRAEELERIVQVRTQELKQEREQLQAILSNTGDGIFYTEGNEIRFANDTLCKMTGYTQGELIGHTSSTLQKVDEQDLINTPRLSSIIRVNANMPTFREETEIERKDGSRFIAGLTISFMGVTNEGQMRAVTIVRDISQAKELEAKQRRFIANAAHELRAPISTLNTRMYLLRQSPDKVERHIERLDGVVTRINALIGDLLDMSYFESGQIQLHPTNVILQDVLLNVINLQEDEAKLKDIELINAMSNEPIAIWADVTRIEQVILNLVRNSIRFIPPQGSIVLSCDVNTIAEIAIIEVRDTGVGIAPQHLENIFQPFYRINGKHNPEGTGLGLSISREIVERHGGRIWAESALNIGTSFFIELPILNA